MVADVVAAFGRVDILVNCAAKPERPDQAAVLAELTTEEFWDHLNTKVVGYMRTAREVAPHMMRRSGAASSTSAGSARARPAHRRQHPQRQRGGADQEPRRRAGAERHLGGLRASGPDAHGGDAGRDRAPRQGARHQPRGGREADGVRQRAEAHHHGRGIAHVCAFLASPKAVAINGDAIAAGGGAPGSIYY